MPTTKPASDEAVEPVSAKASSNLGADSKSVSPQTCPVCEHFVNAGDDACGFCGFAVQS